MRVPILPLLILLAQYTTTTLAAPVRANIENMVQILSDLVIPQEQHNGTYATNATAQGSPAPAIKRAMSNLLIPSEAGNGVSTSAHASSTLSASETNPNQLQITRRLLLPSGRQFRVTNGPANRNVVK